MPIIETAHGRLPTGAASQLLELSREDDFYAVGLLREAARFAEAAGADAAAQLLRELADDPDGTTDAKLARVDLGVALDAGAAIGAAFCEAAPDKVPYTLRGEHAELHRVLAAHDGGKA